MSPTDEQRERVLSYYGGVTRWMRPAVESLVDDADAVIARAREIFGGMLDDMPYIDPPMHTMAGSMFSCGAMLAIHLVVRERGVDAHAWGRAIHALPVVLPEGTDEDRERGRADAQESQAAGEGEFVFEMLDAADGIDRGMNITSCAICHLFGKHDAMELVPYMCSFDDVVSDSRGDGLRRTGSIALGADRCDFRYKTGGDPLALASQYPERIRLNDE